MVEARYVVRSAPALTPAEATSIWMQYLTAYYPITEIQPLGAGQFVLVTAATSTAGSAMLELGRLRGVTTIGTTRDPRNEAFLRDRGADHVLVSGCDDLAVELDRITGGRGVDLAFDCVAGDLLAHNVVFHPYSVFHYVGDPESLARGVDFVNAALAAGRIRPVVDRVFAMEDYVDAWDYLSGPRARHGKVVVETGL